MKGDKAVGWIAIFAAGFIAGQWTSGREALGQGTKSFSSSPTYASIPRCKLQAIPATPRTARRWAKDYVSSRRDGVILK